MAVQQLDNFWSMLMQGVPQGFQMHQQIQERKDRQAQLERENAIRGAEMALRMYEAGAADPNTVNTAFSTAAKFSPMFQGMKVNGPSAAGLRKEIAMAPNVQMALPTMPGVMAGGNQQLPGAMKYTDQQLEFAGMRTRPQREAEQLQLRGARQGIDIGNEQLAGARFENSPEMLETKRFKARQEAIARMAEGAVGKAVNDIGGLMRINPDNIPKLVDKGFAELEKSGTLKMFGTLDEGTKNFIKNDMHSKLLDAYAQAYGLESQRQASYMRLQAGQGNQWDKYLDNLENMKARAIQEINGLQAVIDGFPSFYKLIPPDQQHKQKGVDFSKYNEAVVQMTIARQHLNDLKATQAKFMNGQLRPDDINSGVGMQPQGVVIQQGAGAGQTVAPGQAPAQGGQQRFVPQGPPAPGQSAPSQAPVPAGPTRDMTPDEYTAIYSMLSANPQTFMVELKRMVDAKLITMNDARKLGYKP